jgi:membrane-associated protein
MSDFAASFLSELKNFGELGYLVLFFVVLGESFVITGIFMPGTIVLLIMGGLSLYGYYNPFLLGIAGFAGALAGNALSYELGRAGKVQAQSFSFIRYYMGTAKEFVERHHGKSLILCHFVGPIRAIVPFMGGITGMKRGPFYSYTVAGIILWIAVYIAFGYAFGYAWKSALGWSSAAVTIGVVACIVLFVAYRWIMAAARR